MHEKLVFVNRHISFQFVLFVNFEMLLTVDLVFVTSPLCGSKAYETLKFCEKRNQTFIYLCSEACNNTAGRL